MVMGDEYARGKYPHFLPNEDNVNVIAMRNKLTDVFCATYNTSNFVKR
jgi:hypothetical protein